MPFRPASVAGREVHGCLRRQRAVVAAYASNAGEASLFSSAVSTRRMTVSTPSAKIAGSTMVMNGTNTSRDRDANPRATSELDSENT